MKKEQKIVYRDSLVQFANDLGFEVELDAYMTDWVEQFKEDPENKEYFDEDGAIIKEFRPAGYCNYMDQRICVREGKGLDGQISTLIHEISHAIGLGGKSWYSLLGERYVELAAESITQIVTSAIGLDRTKQTATRIVNYGFTNYLISPLTLAISSIFLKRLNSGHTITPV